MTRITIPLTGTIPISIDLNDWREIAGAEGNGSTTLTVYKHDRAHVVFGRYEDCCLLPAGSKFDLQEGKFVPAGEDVVEAVKEVGNALHKAACDYGVVRRGVIDQLVKQCLDSFPPLEV